MVRWRSPIFVAELPAHQIKFIKRWNHLINAQKPRNVNIFVFLAFTEHDTAHGKLERHFVAFEYSRPMAYCV